MAKYFDFEKSIYWHSMGTLCSVIKDSNLTGWGVLHVSTSNLSSLYWNTDKLEHYTVTLFVLYLL